MVLAYDCVRAVLTLCNKNVFPYDLCFHFYMFCFTVGLLLPATFSESQSVLTDEFVRQGQERELYLGMGVVAVQQNVQIHSSQFQPSYLGRH